MTSAQNGDAVPGHKPKRAEDKEYLISDRDAPPKYDSAENKAEGDESGTAEKPEPGPGPRVPTLQLVSQGNR